MKYDPKKYPMKPEVVKFLETVSSNYPSHSDAASIEDGRLAYAAMCKALDPPLPDRMVITDSTVAGRDGAIPIRNYAAADQRSAVTVIYFHGGGFSIGNLDTHNTICADLAERTGYRVMAVEYRLTPEHPFPAHFHDAYDAFHALDEGNTIVCGDSAGGTLAAAVCSASKGSSKQPLGQVLIYPFLGGVVMDLPSYTECADAPMLTTQDVHHFEKLRCDGEPSVADPAYFPLVEEDFSDLPPCAAFAAQFDPIRDDAVEYVRKLNAAGVASSCAIESGLTHGFLRGRAVSPCIAETFSRICAAIQNIGSAA